MKKQIFLVGALVAVAMSSMFVACADKNTPDDKTKTIAGCTCTFQEEGEERETFEFTYSELVDLGLDRTSCKGAERYAQEANDIEGIEVIEDVTCKAYY
ncbi:MAG: hypothetical protein ACI30A_07360 [Paludibacteraceae bacterium]